MKLDEVKIRKFTFRSVDGRTRPSDKALKDFLHQYDSIVRRQWEEDLKGTHDENT